MRTFARVAVAAIISLVLCLPAIAQAKADTKDFVNVTMVLMGEPKNAENEKVMAKWNEYLKEKLNASLTIRWVEWSDYMTKYNLLLASGEPVDLVFTASDWLDFWQNVQRNAFMPIEKLLPLYAPKTYAEIPKDHWKAVTYQGHIWEFPENSYTQYVNHGFFYRGDWAKEFGISKVNSFEDLAKYFQGVKDKKPGVIPWDVAGNNATAFSTWNGWLISKTDAVDLRLPTGLFWAPDYKNAFTAKSFVFDPTYVEYAKTMKQWADKGYWRKDVLNFTGNTRDELRGGISGADQHHTQTYRGLRYNMDKDQPGSNLQFWAFSDTRKNLVNEPITHGGTAIAASSKNPERAMMVYELIRQDPYFYRLFNYGIEGVNYKVENGKRVNPTEPFNPDKNGYEISFWGGRTDKFELPTTTEYAGIYDIWKANDKFQKPFPYGQFIFNKAPVDPQIAAVQDVVNKYMPAINFGKVDNPTKAVEEFRAKLKAAGYDKLLAEIQKQLTAYGKTQQ